MSTKASKHEESIFEKPIYVTNPTRKKKKRPEMYMNISYLFPMPKKTGPEYWEWYDNYFKFAVAASDYRRALAIKKRMRQAYDNNDIDEAERIFNEELLPLKANPFKQLGLREKWAYMMMQMSKTIGGPNKEIIKEIISERYPSGKILEAMCGFDSYLGPSDGRTVIALDLCKEALERYPYPERTRILFNLNEIDCKRIMGFFKEGEFDVIVICFGFQYLKHPGFVFKELRRILKPGGRLCLVENHDHCYEGMACRNFSVDECLYYLKLDKVGFKEVKVEILPIREPWELGAYHLVEAIKS